MTMKQLNPTKVALPAGSYSQGVVTHGSGTWLYISGQVGITREGVMSADVAEQGDIAWANVGHVLAEAGMDFSHLVKTVTYVVGVENVPVLSPVRLKHTGAAKPAATLVVVDALAFPEWKVEVEAVAFKS